MRGSRVFSNPVTIDVRYRAALISLFSTSCHHSPDTILGFLQIFVMQEEGAHQFYCHHSILVLVQNFIGFMILVIIPQIQPFVFNFCDARISRLLLTLSLIVVLVHSCVIQLDNFKPIMEVTKEVTTSVY